MGLMLPYPQEKDSTDDATNLAESLILVNSLKSTLNETIIKYNELLATLRSNKGGY